MSTTIVPKTITAAVEIGETFLKRAAELCANQGVTLTGTVYLSDGSQKKDMTVEEIVSFHNLDARSITAISLESTTTKPLNVDINIGNRFSGVAGINVSGDDRAALYLANELEILTRNCRQWYWPLSTPPKYLGMAYFSVVMFPVGLFLFKVSGDNLVQLAGFLFAFVWLLTKIEKAAKKIFPPITFAIGDGVIRANRISQRRRAVFSVICVAIIIGLGVNLASAKVWEILTASK